MSCCFCELPQIVYCSDFGHLASFTNLTSINPAD